MNFKLYPSMEYPWGGATGATADGKTVTPNETETFKSEKFREIRTTILTDVKNLNKARKVIWNDTQGKTGASAIKQIFSNIKHNIRAAWIGKKGELEASENLKADIKEFKKMLNETVFDPDLEEDCKKFYDELKGKRPGGYADTKERLMGMIGEQYTDETLKSDVESFLKGCRIGFKHKGLTLEIGHEINLDNLVERFKATLQPSGLEASQANDKIEEFKTLLESYESRLPSSKLEKEIEKLFDKELLDEARKKACLSIDKKRDALIEHIDAFSKGDYSYTNMEVVDLPTNMGVADLPGGYRLNSSDRNVKALLNEFREAFPGASTEELENALSNALQYRRSHNVSSGKELTGTEKKVFKGLESKMNIVKTIVENVAKNQKKKINAEPKEDWEKKKLLDTLQNEGIETELFGRKKDDFLEEVKIASSREVADSYASISASETIIQKFSNQFDGFKSTKTKLSDLLKTYNKESEEDLFVLDQLEALLDMVEVEEGWRVPDDPDIDV